MAGADVEVVLVLELARRGEVRRWGAALGGEEGGGGSGERGGGSEGAGAPKKIERERKKRGDSALRKSNYRAFEDEEK